MKSRTFTWIALVIASVFPALCQAEERQRTDPPKAVTAPATVARMEAWNQPVLEPDRHSANDATQARERRRNRRYC